MDKVRLGIIGIGNIGTSHAANVAKGEVPEMELTAVAEAPLRPWNSWAKAFRLVSVGLNTRMVEKRAICDSACKWDRASKPEPMTPTERGLFGRIVEAPTAVVAAVRSPVTRLPSSKATSSAVCLSKIVIR